jgi:hypothetical protein
VAESLLLAAGGAVVGWVLGALCLAALRGLAPPQTPRLDAIRLDGAVAAWTLGLSLLVGLAAGCLSVAVARAIAGWGAGGGRRSRPQSPRRATPCGRLRGYAGRWKRTRASWRER